MAPLDLRQTRVPHTLPYGRWHCSTRTFGTGGNRPSFSTKPVRWGEEVYSMCCKAAMLLCGDLTCRAAVHSHAQSHTHAHTRPHGMPPTAYVARIAMRMNTHAHTRVRAHTHAHTHSNTHAYAHMHIQIHAHVHIHTRIHAHILRAHTHAPKRCVTLCIFPKTATLVKLTRVAEMSDGASRARSSCER